MAKQTLIDSTVLVGGTGEALDVSGSANSALFDGSVEELDSSAFSDLARRRVGGLATATFAMTVMDEASTAEPWTTLSDLFAVNPAYFAWIESNASMAEEDFGVMLKALESSFSRGGEVGAMRQMQIGGSGDGQLIVAQVLQQDESLSSSGNSTGFQFGALAAGETLWATQFVLSATAGTLDGIIVSDSQADFAASKETQITFTQQSTVDAEQGSVAGAVTDDWWRYEYTIATGPFTVVVLMGKALV